MNWRVKAGNREVFYSEKRMDCEAFIRRQPKVDGKKCRLIPPNA